MDLDWTTEDGIDWTATCGSYGTPMGPARVEAGVHVQGDYGERSAYWVKVSDPYLEQCAPQFGSFYVSDAATGGDPDGATARSICCDRVADLASEGLRHVSVRNVYSNAFPEIVRRSLAERDIEVVEVEEDGWCFGRARVLSREFHTPYATVWLDGNFEVQCEVD